jgi:hypothetical protein
MGLKKAARELQHKFAMADLLTRPGKGGGYSEFLVIKLLAMKIKMYQEQGPHKEPHVHIDYGKNKHVASYSIQSGRRIIGDLDRKYDKIVQSWIVENNEALAELWRTAQAGKDTETLVASLRAPNS